MGGGGFFIFFFLNAAVPCLNRKFILLYILVRLSTAARREKEMIGTLLKVYPFQVLTLYLSLCTLYLNSALTMI